MELMVYGDLKTFLLARRHLVNEKITEDSDIHPKKLTMMALDVSRALSYLASQKYVHRDVACRNCLVSGKILFYFRRVLSKLIFFSGSSGQIGRFWDESAHVRFRLLQI